MMNARYLRIHYEMDRLLQKVKIDDKAGSKNCQNTSEPCHFKCFIVFHNCVFFDDIKIG
jgi:hypothetical protein